MSWTDCDLGDVVTLKRGHDLPNGSRIYGIIPVVSSSGITGWHHEAEAEPPGVVTGRYDTIGEVFYLDRPYWPLNTALYAIDFHGNSPRFVAYFLRNQLKNYQSEKRKCLGWSRKSDWTHATASTRLAPCQTTLISSARYAGSGGIGI